MYSTRSVTDLGLEMTLVIDSMYKDSQRYHHGTLHFNGSPSIIKAHKAQISLHFMYSTTSTTLSRELTH